MQGASVTVDLQPQDVSRASSAAPFGASAVSLRRFPYPYRAMLAICSDLDETRDALSYEGIMRFLNTNELTAMGKGVGLEVGNTIYFDMSPGQFAYWSTDDAGRAMVRRLIHSGHVDCLHSFGDLAATRDHAARALDELASHDCRIEVWVDHSKAVSNFGPDIMVGSGDVPGADAYHADLSCAYGVQFVWRGRTTSVIGQNVPRRLRGLFDPRHPLASGRTLAKQVMKVRMGKRGNEKYAMHVPNRVLRRDRLRDGTEVYEFLRFNPHGRGVGEGATADGASEVLTKKVLDTLIERQGVGVLYTHLGKTSDPEGLFPTSTVDAFRLLSEYYQGGKILVTTTRRLLGYVRTYEELNIRSSPDGSSVSLDEEPAMPSAHAPRARSDYDGLTVYVSDPSSASLTLGGRPVGEVRENLPDQTGRASVSLPWPRLEYPTP